MSYDDQTRAWLIQAVDRRWLNDNPYQYGYIIPIQDRRVIVTATGYIAHYSWDIPEADQETLIEHNGIQIVDFGFGKGIEAAKGWQKTTSAFSNLLKRFSECEVVGINSPSFLRAVNHIHLCCIHDFQDGVMTRLVCKSKRMHISNFDETVLFDFPVQTALRDDELRLTIQSRYLISALSGFENMDSVSCRFLMKPDLLAIGNEGDKVAVIMGIVFD